MCHSFKRTLCLVTLSQSSFTVPESIYTAQQKFSTDRERKQYVCANDLKILNICLNDGRICAACKESNRGSLA